MNREYYDLSHQVHQVGRIGQWAVLSYMNVVAGDSINLRYRCVIQQSPLRRQVIHAPVVDLVTAFVPYRFCELVKDSWETFIKEGIDTTVTFGTVAHGASDAYVPWIEASEAMPWYLDAIRQVWRRYLRPAHSVLDWTRNSVTGVWEYSNRALVGPTAQWHAFGPFATALPNIYNGMIQSQEITPADYEVSAAADKFSILDLARVKARYDSELRREWFARRYNDVLQEVFGTSTPSYLVEEIPEILRVSTHTLDGMELRGVGDNTLGNPVGIGRGVVVHDVPKRYFDEHGIVVTMATVRYPCVWYEEKLYQPNGYKELAGDPAILVNEPPLDATADRFFRGGAGGVTLGKQPYGQWFRSHPNFVRDRFEVVNGFPFRTGVPGNAEAIYWHDQRLGDALFQTQALAHHQFHCAVDVDAVRVVPKASSSIFAGVR